MSITRLQIPKMRMESFAVIQREEDIPKGDNMVEGILFLEAEEEEEEERKNVMPMERHGICLGNVLRKINKEEEKLTFLKRRGGMLKQKKLNMENPSW